ncbi:MAG: YfiR family protein [Terriglobales bacterium]
MASSKSKSCFAAWKVRAAAGCVATLMLLGGAWNAFAQNARRDWANEYELKAAFVYKLLSFVEWPTGTLGDRLIVGVAGEGPTAVAVTHFLNGKRLAALPIEVREVHSHAAMRECNALIVAYSDSSRTREVLHRARNMSVLTIGEGENFARMGGVVALVPRDHTFQVGINPRAAERAGLKISAKLLSLSKLLPDEDNWQR